MKVFLDLGWFFKSHWKKYTAAILLFIGVGILEMLVPIITGELIDEVVNKSLTRQDLYIYAGGILAIASFVYFFRYLWRVMLFSASFKLAEILRQKLYLHLTQLAPEFFQKHRTGDLMARATNDITAVEMTAGEGVLSATDGLITSLFVMSIMTVVIDWRLTLVALLPFPLMAWFFRTIGTRLHHSFKDAQERFSDLNDRVQESVAGIRMIKSFGREDKEDAEFLKIADLAAEANMDVARTDSLYDPAIFLTVGTSFLLCVGYGGWLVHLTELTLGQLTSFTMYLGYLIWPMFAYGWLMNIVERGSAAWGRISELFDTKSAVQDNGKIDVIAEPAIELNIKQFRYPVADSNPDSDAGNIGSLINPVLEGIQLQVKPGEILGIVGHTGAGKSTLLSLLMRHYDGEQVEIKISGNLLSEYSLSALRRGMSVVPQDAFLFSASIQENIALGVPDANMEQIREVAKIASIDQDIMSFPDSYDTLVGERGVTLSGGQKQRLSIARALLVDAPILILDDALSAVDVATEKSILQHLKEARKDRTTIIICHRLTAVEDAQQILVLNHGQQVELGNHNTLVKSEGWYQRMFEYQKLEQTVESGK